MNSPLSGGLSSKKSIHPHLCDARSDWAPRTFRLETNVSEAQAQSQANKDLVLSVNNIEVIYDHVIGLRGVSLSSSGNIVALLAQTVQVRRPHLRPSQICKAERGEVTKGDIVFNGEQIHAQSSNALVRKGCIQVMEGRHCFEHLTVEENLLTGAYTRTTVPKQFVITWTWCTPTPRLKERRTALAGYTSGGEQQMCAIGRALMSAPTMILLDEPSMGLAPQLVEEIFGIVKALNEKEVYRSRAGAEHQYRAAIRRLWLHPRVRTRRDGR